MKYSEKWGDSIEGAVELALQDLKLTRDQVNVIVLEEPSRGFFGLGSKLAKVRVEEIHTPKPEVKPAAPKILDIPEKKSVPDEIRESAPVKESNNKEKKPRSQKPRRERSEKKQKTFAEPKADFKLEAETIVITKRPEDLTEVSEHPAKEFLENTIREMGLDLTVKVFVNADSVYADIEGKDTGTIIGKRGQTLDAVSYLTSLVVNKGEDEYIRVVVDAEGYRAKREIILENLAFKLAEKVVKTGRPARLEPMNPYERKVIHTALQQVDAVVTRSEGEEPRRRVVIEPSRNN